MESARHLDEIIRKAKQPHLIHLYLDELYQNAYRTYNSKDAQQRNLVLEHRKHRNASWWEHNKQIPMHIRKRMVDQPQQRRQGVFNGCEDLLDDILGCDWRHNVCEGLTAKQWKRYCRETSKAFFTKHDPPQDPRFTKDADKDDDNVR